MLIEKKYVITIIAILSSIDLTKLEKIVPFLNQSILVWLSSFAKLVGSVLKLQKDISSI